MRKLLSLVLLVLLTLPLGGPPSTAQQGMGPGPGVKTYSAASDFVTDTFTEAGTSTINLNTHVGEVGATWTQHPHANYAGGPLLLNRDLDRVYGTGTSASYASGVPPSADYQVCADFYNVTAIAVNIAVTGRMDTTADTMYLLRLTDGTTWTVRKIVAAAATTLGSSTNQIPTAGGAPKRGCLVMTGDQISGVIEGVTELGPFTDSAITAAGRAGIRSTATSSATTGMHLDSFSAR